MEQKRGKASEPPKVGANEAKKLLADNFLNIAEKVSQGKPLTGAEVKLLEQLANCSSRGAVDVEPGTPTSQTFVKNQTDLAAALGCERKTIQRYRKRPDSPRARSDGRWSVVEWRAYLQKAGAIKSDDLDKQELEAEQLLLKNKRLKNKIAQEQEEWIPRVVARQVFTQFVMGAKARSFASVIRLVTLARVASNTTDAAVEVRKEIESVWKALEESEWYRTAKQT